MTSSAVAFSSSKRHLLPDDRDLIDAASSILSRHESGGLEANISSALIHFLAITGLANRDDIREEDDRIDIQSERLIIETKKRIGGIGAGNDPRLEYVEQLDRYIAEAKAAGKPDRLGVLTDGKHWVLRLPHISEVRLTAPYAFTLRSKEDGYRLYEWLQNETRIIESSDWKPEEEEVRRSFGPGPRFDNEIAALASLYQAHRNSPTIAVKRRLWADLLTAALGICVTEEPDLEQLFLSHTYLSAIVGLAVQAAFGIDLREKARHDPTKLLTGDVFRKETGVQGVLDSDFFAWPAEVGGEQWIVGIADRVARFRWGAAEYDFARILYQSVIPADDRRRLGEYYTPDWLAKAVVDEVMTDPLNQRVLDPSCGSGTFLFAAVQQYIAAAKAANQPAERILDGLAQSVIGIDVHPVSVHLARATWTLAAKEVIGKVKSGDAPTVPVYLGDSLQLRTDSGSLFAQDHVSITVAASGEVKRISGGGASFKEDEAVGDKSGITSEKKGGERRLNFPNSLVAQPDWFDRVMHGLSQAIARGKDPMLVLDDNDIPKGDSDREMLEDTARTLQDLHAEGRNHIWAYYTRNLVRPIWLSSDEGKVDVILGNPPWLTYNKTDATIRSELERQSKNDYKIWTGGRYATHQDIAGLFFARCVDLYLKDGGEIGMVLPHSALAAGQYKKWRSGNWGGVKADLSKKLPWDLERIDPNTFFPIASSVVFARRSEQNKHSHALGDKAKCWQGKLGGLEEKGLSDFEEIALADASSDTFVSPYSNEARQGATIVPRLLYFVDVQPSPTALARGIVKVSPRRSSQEKEPWKSLWPADLTGAPIEEEHIWDVHLGETVAPYVLLEPLKAVLPVRPGEKMANPKDRQALAKKNATTIYGLEPRSMEELMRDRWEVINDLWDEHKSPNNKLDLVSNLDYMGKFSSQLEDSAPIRLLYTSSGRPTAAVLADSDEAIDYTLFWIHCDTRSEAYYLASIINSDTLEEAVNKFTIPNWSGRTRHLQKHLWRLPIPIYDPDNSLHIHLATLGTQLAAEAATQLDTLQTSRAAENKPTTITVARRELRSWLSTHPPAQQTEQLVAQLLRGS